MLHLEKHINFINKQESNIFTSHLKMSGVYWAMTSLEVLNKLPKDSLSFISSCQSIQGGFSSDINHDVHILSSLSAVQLLASQNRLDLINDQLVPFVASLQTNDGAFCGDKWGHCDTRFSYCAIALLSILDSLDSINKEMAANYLSSCMNFGK